MKSFWVQIVAQKVGHSRGKLTMAFNKPCGCNQVVKNRPLNREISKTSLKPICMQCRE